MNNQRTLLLGIIITAVAILFVETGVIQFNNQGINAQTELSELILEKDGEKHTIPKGNWVVAVNANDADVFTAGELVGISGDGIIIKNSKKDWKRNIAIQDIGVLYHGDYKRTSKYIWQGVRYGGAVASCVGLFSFAMFAPEKSLSLQESLLCGGIVAAYTGIFTIPAGALIGLITGLVKQGKAVEYVIGPDDWQFVLEQPPVSY